MRLDAIDIKILRALQEDASLAVEEIAQRAGLSKTPCWRRIKLLEAAGVIKKRVALLEQRALGLGATVFVTVRTRQHEADWLQKFASAVAQMPEIVDVYRLSGDVDYMLRVVCADITDYDRVYRELIRRVPLADVSSSFVMEEIKHTTELPIHELGADD